MSTFLKTLAMYSGSRDIRLARSLWGRNLLGLGSLLAVDDDEARTLRAMTAFLQTLCIYWTRIVGRRVLRRLFASELLLMPWTPYLVRMPSVVWRGLAVWKARVSRYCLLPAGFSVPAWTSSDLSR
jgi:hypothetical protein